MTSEIPLVLDTVAAPIWAAFATSVLALLGFIIRYILRLQSDYMTRVRDDNVDDAKDELIDTLQANHEALSSRVELLERKAEGLDRALTEAYASAEDLRGKLADTLERYNELQKYAAPEAVKTLTAMVDAFAHTTNALLVDVLERLTAIETQQNTGLESLANALLALRESVKTGK